MSGERLYYRHRDYGAATLPFAISFCRTNPMSGQCISSIGSTVTTTIGANATPTFAIFATASGSLPFVPQTNRIFVEFSDANEVVRRPASLSKSNNCNEVGII